MATDPLDPFAEPPTDKERIESLENQLEALSETIRRMVELSQNFTMPVLGIEIVRELAMWADPDEGDEG